MGRFSGKKCRLMSMMVLTTAFFIVEIVVGYITNSMALVADSFHMLSDVIALIVAFLSVKMSPKKWSKNTFGWARAEVLGALVNAVFLVALCFSITVEAGKRFIEMEEIHDPKLLLIVGALGLLVNGIGLLLFFDHKSHEHTTDEKPNSKRVSNLYPSPEHGHGHGGHGHSHGGNIARTSRNRLTQLVSTDDNENDETFQPPAVIAKTNHHGHGHSHNASSMNMRGVFLHLLADALGSVIVCCSALVFWLTDWKYKNYIDPALSIVLVLLILHSVWPLLRDSALILLQTVPTHIQVDAIQRRLLAKVDGVLAVHEFHVWQLAGDRIIASAHIRCRNLSEYMKIAEKVKEFFHNEGIHSTTIQPEFIEIPASSDETEQPENCVLDCPKTAANDDCVRSTCCGPSKQGRETPSPGDTPYLCRQRNSVASFTNRLQELNEMEQGALLAAPEACAGSDLCPATFETCNGAARPPPDSPLAKESCV